MYDWLKASQIYMNMSAWPTFLNSSVGWGHGTNTHWGDYSSHAYQSRSSSDAPEKQDRWSTSPEKPLRWNLRMVIMIHTILHLLE